LEFVEKQNLGKTSFMDDKNQLYRIGTHAKFKETQIILDTLQPFDPPAQPVSIDITSTNYKKIIQEMERIHINIPFRKASWTLQSFALLWIKDRAQNY
jgi:hypothetical protein